MNIYEIFEKRSCRVQVDARNKDEMLSCIAELATAGEAASGIAPETIRTALAERESQGSTAFGNEIAIPHARLESLDRFLLFIISSPRASTLRRWTKKR